jgi:hypothetical protein
MGHEQVCIAAVFNGANDVVKIFASWCGFGAHLFASSNVFSNTVVFPVANAL